MNLHGTRRLALLFLGLVAGLVMGCVVLEVRDVRDLAHGLTLANQLSCAAEDGSVQCRCEHRCVTEPSDCHCGD